MTTNKFKKPMLTITFILSLCILSVALNSSSTTSAFSDTASINSTLKTGSVSLNYSGQDYERYFFSPSDRVESAVLDTASEGDWYPERPTITKDITVTNTGDLPCYYTLSSYRSDGFTGVRLDQAIHVKLSIDGNLIYEGSLYKFVTAKHLLNVGQSQKIEFVLSMESTDQDDLYSGLSLNSYMRIDTFLATKTMQSTGTETPISISGESKHWREKLYQKYGPSNTEVTLGITKVDNVHNSILEYSTNSDFSNSVKVSLSHENQTADYYHVLKNLNPGTTYYARTKIESPEFGSGFSNVLVFTTLP